jgi:eukaryotic-like serine/threonine-protein kinase
VYDDAEDQFYQGYPSQGRRGPSLFASILASVLTTIVVFFGLRELDKRGYLGGQQSRARPTPASAAAQSSPTPNLVGLPLEQARELLELRGLLISVAEERDDSSRPPGSILAQNPPAGSGAAANTTVEVVVARAAASLVIPGVVGLKPEEAARQLTARGLQPSAPKSAPSDTVPPGLVAATEPPVGTAVERGTAVVLVVSAAKGTPVPKVVGTRLTRAKKTLEQAGFKVGKASYRYDPCCGEYIILKQTPAEGDMAESGTSVDLIVNEPG